MEVLDFYTLLKEQNINDFESFKTFLEKEPYKLIVKEDTLYPTLCIVINSNESNIQEPLVSFCNGIILEKETFKIVCRTFNKCTDENIIDNKLFTSSNLYIEPSYEGTLIRLFHYNNEWFFSTKKMINARRAKWISSKSFFDLFNEILPNKNIDEYLDKNMCYSFILVHHENNIVIKYPKNVIIHISTFDIVRQCECEVIIGHGIMKSFRQQISFKNEDEVTNYINTIKNDKNIDNEGIIIINENYVRQKFKKNLYIFIRNLWGNTNSRFYRYVELRKNPSDLQNYLIYFEKDKSIFSLFETKISNSALQILDIYRNKYIIKKEDAKIPFYIKDFIFAIHGKFLKSKVKITYEDIMIHILSLDSAKYCFILNNMTKQNNEIQNNEKDVTEMEINEN